MPTHKFLYYACLCFVLFTSQSLAACQKPLQITCLPPERKLTDIVSATLSSGIIGNDTVKTVTVEQKLTELRASCKNNRLVDGSGREIRFYQLAGCWGNPPQNYSDILRAQDEEIRNLEKQYTVINMTCNPGGIPLP
ncbi:MAG: hypothetical protein QNJ51_08495 [Calothrix sp. MO_167.B12]|nr:hypothetical protein [Calothrix sp. MO_167.B12]